MKKIKYVNVMIIMIVLTCLLSACSTSVENLDEGGKELEELAAVQNEKLQLCVYYPNAEKNMLQKEIREVEKEEILKSVNNLARVVINEVMSGPTNSSGLKNEIPNTVSLLEESIIDSSTGVAKINFDGDFVNAFENANIEKLVLAAFVNSLTEIKEISGLQILVEGKNVEKMKNGTPIKDVLKRDVSLILPSESLH